MPENSSRSGIPTLLIGAAGTGTAFGAIMAARRLKSQSLRIVGIDINPPELVTSSLLCDATVQVPLASDPGFSAKLSEILVEHQADAFLPLLPAEVQVAVDLCENPSLGEPLQFLFGSPLMARLSVDKLAMARWLESQQLPTPKSAEPSGTFGSAAVFLKPKSGSGSRGARRVTREELQALLPNLDAGWMVQEVCEGVEVTVDAFFDPATGYIRALARDRLEIKAGVSTKCRIREDPELEELAFRLATGLGAAGSFCFQVLGEAGKWSIIDVNSRPGAASAMSAVCGNDFFGALISRWLGGDFESLFHRLDTPVLVTRQYAEFRMN